MSLRQRLILTAAVVSLASAAAFSLSLLYLTRSTLNLWDNRAVERSVEIAASAARDPTEQAEALQGFRAYHQLRAVKNLIGQRIWIAGLLFGLAVFALSAGISSIVFLRITRPLKELTSAIDRAGRGDLTVRVKARPSSEIGTVTRAFNRMTERLHRLQEDLKRSERLAAWRDVARILGHEIRNPLTPIRLSVERLQLKAEKHSPDLELTVQRSSRMIIEEIEALDRLVREFSEFARLPEPEPEPVDLNRLLADLARQYSLTSPGIEIVSDLDPELDTWPMDPQLMRQALGNILKNSVEALGTHPAPDGRQIRVRTRVTGDACRIEIADNGPGIPEQHQDRVLDPYFTTKTKGTGLGLAVVRNVVSEHDGEVLIESSKAGTTVTVLLPRGIEHADQTAGG